MYYQKTYAPRPSDYNRNGKLSINIDLKAAFCSHLDLYDEDGILAAKAYSAN